MISSNDSLICSLYPESFKKISALWFLLSNQIPSFPRLQPQRPAQPPLQRLSQGTTGRTATPAPQPTKFWRWSDEGCRGLHGCPTRTQGRDPGHTGSHCTQKCTLGRGFPTRTQADPLLPEWTVLRFVNLRDGDLPKATQPVTESKFPEAEAIRFAFWSLVSEN